MTEGIVHQFCAKCPELDAKQTSISDTLTSVVCQEATFRARWRHQPLRDFVSHGALLRQPTSGIRGTSNKTQFGVPDRSRIYNHQPTFNVKFVRFVTIFDAQACYFHNQET
jgi:hypothetical protein